MDINPLDEMGFDAYVILADILPGSLIVGTVLARTNLKYFEIFPDSISIILFVFMAFIIGQIIHCMASIAERFINKTKYGSYPSSKIFLDEDTTFPKYFKDNIRKKLNENYGTPLDSSSQHIFEICYTFITQNKLSVRAMTFLNMYTFSRNIMVTLCLEGIMLSIWAYIESNVYIGYFAAISFCSTYFFYIRFIRYADSFVKEVITSYFVSQVLCKEIT